MLGTRSRAGKQACESGFEQGAPTEVIAKRNAGNSHRGVSAFSNLAETKEEHLAPRNKFGEIADELGQVGARRIFGRPSDAVVAGSSEIFATSRYEGTQSSGSVAKPRTGSARTTCQDNGNPHVRVHSESIVFWLFTHRRPRQTSQQT